MSARSGLTALLAFAVTVLAAGLDPHSRTGFAAWSQLRAETRDAQARADHWADAVASLETEIAAFDRGGLALERAIRAELGWARPGEIVVRMPSDTAADRPALPVSGRPHRLGVQSTPAGGPIR